MDLKSAEKKERLLSALEQGMVMVHLDARRPGVSVPDDLAVQAHLRLNLSYRFDPPDLKVGEWGVRSTLSFNSTRCLVAIPWSALFAITSHVTKEFWLYPDDMPPEVIQQGLATAQAMREVPGDKPRSPGGGTLRGVEGGAGAKDEKEPEDSKPRRSHLRVVK